MNDLLHLLALEPWKPVLTALLLPPVPWLLGVVVGARLLWRRRPAGWWLVLSSIAALWLGSTTGAAAWLTPLAGLGATAMSPQRVAAVTARVRAAPPGRAGVAIVVLGGGRESLAPEYGAADLGAESMRRLRYGLWLARATGAPIAFSGGQGWAQRDGEPEAQIAARVAATEFGRPLRWIESRSRDTRANARLTMPMLRADGIDHVLLVTHGWHMTRALRAFTDEAEGITVEPAPTGLSVDDDILPVEWLPSEAGMVRCRQLMREWLGLRLGA